MLTVEEFVPHKFGSASDSTTATPIAVVSQQRVGAPHFCVKERGRVVAEVVCEVGNILSPELNQRWELFLQTCEPLGGCLGATRAVDATPW